MQRLMIALVGLSAAAAVPFVLAGGDTCSQKASPTAGATLVSTGGCTVEKSSACSTDKATLVSIGGSGCTAEKASTCSTDKTALVSTGGGCTAEKASTSSTDKPALVSTGGGCTAEKASTSSTDKPALVSTGGGCTAEKASTCSTDKPALVSTGGGACASEKTATVSTGDCADKTAAAKSSCCPSDKAASVDASLVSTGESAPAAKPLDALKSLVGRWEATKPVEGMPAAAIEFKLSSNGSTVVETMFPGQPHEMINTYVMDGDDLLLTHYCAAGNQPRMKLASNDGKTMKFKFVDATNLKSTEAPHMGALELTIVNENLINEKWTSFENGQATTHAEFELKRVK